MKNNLANYLTRSILIGSVVIVLLGGTAFAATAPANAVITDNTTSAKLSERTAERKKALKLQLSIAQTQKIVKNCSAAQTLVKNIATKDKASADKRQEVYATISTKVTTTIRRLQSQGEETTDLKTTQIQFDAAVNQYLADALVYKTTIEDITILDCASDPTGFEVTLVTARDLRTKLASDVAQVKTARSTLVQDLAKTAETMNSGASGVNQ